MGILAIDDTILLAIQEQSWHLTIPNIFELNLKGIVLKLIAVFLGHLQRKGNDELRRLDVFIGDLKSDHLEWVKSWVDDLKYDIFWVVLEAVEECGGGAHRSSPKDKLLKALLS